MKDLLELSNGNLHAPEGIRGVVKFPGKGVAIRNEFNKMLDFVKEPDPARQQVIVDVLRRVLQQGREWKQPNWDAEFDKQAKVVSAEVVKEVPSKKAA